MRRTVFAVGAAAVVVLEVAVLVLVAQLVGWWTVPLLLATSLVGGWLLKREGVRTLASVRDGMQRGDAPDATLADAGVVVVGGLLILVPGFVTDLLGMLVVVPPTRRVARRVLASTLGSRVTGLGPTMPAPVPGQDAPADADRPTGSVVQGKVLSPEERPDS